MSVVETLAVTVQTHTEYITTAMPPDLITRGNGCPYLTSLSTLLTQLTRSRAIRCMYLEAIRNLHVVTGLSCKFSTQGIKSGQLIAKMTPLNNSVLMGVL